MGAEDEDRLVVRARDLDELVGLRDVALELVVREVVVQLDAPVSIVGSTANSPWASRFRGFSASRTYVTCMFLRSCSSIACLTEPMSRKLSTTPGTSSLLQHARQLSASMLFVLMQASASLTCRPHTLASRGSVVNVDGGHSVRVRVLSGRFSNVRGDSQLSRCCDWSLARVRASPGVHRHHDGRHRGRPPSRG